MNAQTNAFPAPVRGWVENENLSHNQGVGASVLENCFPLTDTVRVRKGMLKVAAAGSALQGLLPYHGGSTQKFFACTADDIYDASSLDPLATLTSVWGQTGGGRFSYLQIDTGGGQFLLAVNGVTSMLCFDGAGWFPVNAAAVNKLLYDGATTTDFDIGETLTGGTSGATATIVGHVPTTATTGTLYIGAVTGGPFQNNEAVTAPGAAAVADGVIASVSAATVTGVATSTWSHIWLYKSRVWAVGKNTLTAWYLPVDAIGGAADSFALGGVFHRGGSLLFGATWSADSGDGMDDRIVFVSDQGEVAVYQGTDPAADDWALIGRYDIGKPVSPQTMRAGGDLLIATTDGIVPISAIVQKDPAALAMAAVSYPIQPAWLRVSRSNTASSPVQMLKWQKESMGLIGYPHRTGSLAETHVVNLTTGAWSKWTGLDVQCVALYRDKAYYGDTDGFIYEIEGTGSDNGALYVARVSLLPDHLGAPGAVKTVLMARATFRSLRSFEAKLSVATDYRTSFPPAPSAVVVTGVSSQWDDGLWDTAVWDGDDATEARVTATTRWRSIGRTGYAVAPQMQITCGSTLKPDAELVQVDLLYTVGGSVV